MARYTILRLNKMTCGSRRGLIDMDIQIQGILPETYLLPATNLNILPNNENDAGIATESNTNYEYTDADAIFDYYNNDKSALVQENSTSYVLTESQQTIELSTYNNKLSSTDNLSGSSAIQLTPDYWLSSIIDQSQIDAFNSSLSSIRIVYEFELDAIANSAACLNDGITQFLPLNDILDVCIKSMFKKTAINYSIPGNLLLQNHNMTYSKNVDQYFVFDKNPISFCQYKNDAFIMSQPTTKQPYRLQSNLRTQLQTNTLNEAHSFELVQDDIETVLYKNTYDDYTQYNEIDKWTPTRYIKGINYNYIVELEQNSNQNKQYDNPTIYSNGDIFGYFTLCKNMYDALYSMHMDDLSSISQCRMYCGIQSNGTTLALKYYDSSNYYFSTRRENVAYANLLSSSSSVSNMYPYQKIETFQPISFGRITRHKSNLFSLKISNSGLDEQSTKNYDDEQRMIAEQMKKDIANSIKSLANSIAPANTQLFATYFIDVL